MIFLVRMLFLNIRFIIGAEIMLYSMTGFLEQIAVGCPDDAESYDEDVHFVIIKVNQIQA